MIYLIVQMCIGALLGALTVLGLMVVFLALCIVMKAIAYVLSTEANELNLPR